MPNGKYEPQCQNCMSFSTDRPDRRNCTRYDFVAPLFDEYVVCYDWCPKWNESGSNPLTKILERGFIYRWSEYSQKPPLKIGRPEDIQELLLDRTVELVENPDHGWLIYIPDWDHLAYPDPGVQILIAIGDEQTAFLVKDIQAKVTYTTRDPTGSLLSENRSETRRALMPVDGASRVLLQWIDRHHGLSKSREAHERNLANPRFLNKNKPLRLFERITGRPAQGAYALEVGMGVPNVG